uniref:Uncharacterized protein n=1 Tax=Anguilla anguilla TaxID=7936 RepID=A0A0E9SYZ7_ANGAN
MKLNKYGLAAEVQVDLFLWLK